MKAITIFGFFLCLGCLLLSGLAVEPIEITDYDSAVLTKFKWLLYVEVPNCQACKDGKYAWDRIVEHLDGNTEGIRTAWVDGAKNHDLRASMSITVAPTIALVDEGMPYIFPKMGNDDIYFSELKDFVENYKAVDEEGNPIYLLKDADGNAITKPAITTVHEYNVRAKMELEKFDDTWYLFMYNRASIYSVDWWLPNFERLATKIKLTDAGANIHFGRMDTMEIPETTKIYAGYPWGRIIVKKQDTMYMLPKQPRRKNAGLTEEVLEHFLMEGHKVVPAFTKEDVIEEDKRIAEEEARRKEDRKNHVRPTASPRPKPADYATPSATPGPSPTPEPKKEEL